MAELRAKIEAIIYAAEEPVTVEHIASVLKDMVTLPAAEDGTVPDLKSLVRSTLEALVAEYDDAGRGMEIRQVAGGYRMSTKPEHHDAVRAFAKSLKAPVRLSLPALETLAVIAYKQPVTVPEISEIRGVDAGGVIGTLLDRKLITTAGRKAVVGRPILYKTTKEFLMRFGLKDVHELPSIEEFEKLAAADLGQASLFTPQADATGVPDVALEAEASPAPSAEDARIEAESTDSADIEDVKNASAT
jgi:segregation and condensation protein B